MTAFQTLHIKRRNNGLPGPPDALGMSEPAYNEVDGTLWIGVGGTIEAAALITRLNSLVVVSDTPPSLPTVGDMWFDSVGGLLYLFYDDGNSKQWVNVAGGGGGASGGSGTGGGGATMLPGGALGQVLTKKSVADYDTVWATPVQASTANPAMDGAAAPGTAAVFACGDHVHPSDTSRLPIAGGTLTGPLILAADPSDPLGAASKQYVDSKGGGAVLLNTLTANNSPSLVDLTSLTAAYREYEIHLINVIPAVAKPQLQLQVHSGGAYKNSGYIAAFGGFGAGTYYSFSTTGFISLSYPAANNALNPNNVSPGISGVMRVVAPSVNAICSMYGTLSWISSNGNAVIGTGCGSWNTPGVIDGFQILCDNGNIASGIVKIYGVP